VVSLTFSYFGSSGSSCDANEIVSAAAITNAVERPVFLLLSEKVIGLPATRGFGEAVLVHRYADARSLTINAHACMHATANRVAVNNASIPLNNTCGSLLI